MDGALHHEHRAGGGDIITERKYGNFELRLQWKVARGTNSGIIYRVAEGPRKSHMTGPEYQILDDPGTGNAMTSAGSLYALYPATDKTAKPAGAWNTARIIVDGSRLEHWLNGKRVVVAQWGSRDWRERIANSKFAKWKTFGQIDRGHICLQDHGGAVWYRGIEIRELPPTEPRLGPEIELFDGKSLQGWHAHLAAGDPAEVWSVTNEGGLACKGRPRGYLCTVRHFRDFVLRFQWRANPETKAAGNSGVLLRANGPHKVWPRSIEAQLRSGKAGDLWNIDEFGMSTAQDRTEGRRTKATHDNERPLGAWNDYEIIEDGGWVSLRVNGEVVNEAWNCEEIAGPICLQSEGAEIHFRKICLHRLGR